MRFHNPRWPQYGFALLLTMLLAFLVINPILLETPAGNVVLEILISSIILSIMYLLKKRTYTFSLFLILLLPTLYFSWSNLVEYSSTRQITALSLNLVILIIAMGSIFSHLLRYRSIDLNIIMGALCLYIMAAMSWGLLYAILEIGAPGSFSGVLTGPYDLTHLDKTNATFTSLIYFSVVTITTLGYGDITPISTVARSAAIIEVLFGVFYLGTIISTLIGLRLHQSILEREGLDLN